MRLGGPMRSMNTTTSRCSTRPRQEATVRGVRWALLCTRGRDWASETPRSLRRPPSTFPLHCTHPSSSTDSTCLRPRHAMGYLRLVVIAVRQGTPRPAGGTVVGNFVQPPATISTGLDHLYCLQPASARRRAPRGPGRGGLGEYWVYITAVISGPATAGPGSQVTKGFRHGRFLTPGFTPLKLKLKLKIH